MSEFIAFEIQEEILKRQTAKSLIQFRSVSKAWKSLIDSPEFIAAHAVRHSQSQRLIVRYDAPVTSEKNYACFVDDRYDAPVTSENNYVCFVDDDTFPHLKFTPTVPLSVEKFIHSRVIGTSHGLLCLYGYYPDSEYLKKSMFVLWNPSIRKSIAIVDFNTSCEKFVGFGVCPVTGDPKIINLTHINRKPSQFQVYTVSSGKWTSISTNLPSQSIAVRGSQVVIDGFVHWLATYMVSMDGEWQCCPLILSFDTSNESLRVIDLSDSLTPLPSTIWAISKVWDSLAVLEYGLWITDDGEIHNQMAYNVWIMEDMVSKSFTKHFTIKIPYGTGMTVLGFRKSGEAVLETQDYVSEDVSLVVCEPHSEHVHDLGINGCEFSVNSYSETLVLLDQKSDGSMQVDDDRKSSVDMTIVVG